MVQVLSAGTMIGDNVRNPQGEDLGTLKELMIDLSEGRVAYAVLSFGGFLGVGDKLFAIPWGMLDVDTDSEEIVLNVDKDTLKNAPGFDKDNWPDMANREWATEIYSYYDYEPYWE